MNVLIPCIYTFSTGWQRALPPGYQHLVCAFKAEEQRVVLKVKLSLREQVENWLKDFQLSSSLTWRKARTYPESGRYNTYRVSTAWKLISRLSDSCWLLIDFCTGWFQMSVQHLWSWEESKEHKLSCDSFPCPQKKHGGQKIKVNLKMSPIWSSSSMLFYRNVQHLLSFLRLIYRSFNALFLPVIDLQIATW